MVISRVFWVMRAIFYKLFFKKIGFLSYIGKPVFLFGTKRVEIGKKVRIFPGSRIETHNYGTIEIQDGVSIGQNLHLISGGKLIIGENTTISSNVLITNLDHEFRIIDKHILDQPYIIKDTIIGPNCFIGAGAKLQPGTTLGKQCIVGANSVVKGNFPDYCVIVGVPARVIKQYDFKTEKWISV